MNDNNPNDVEPGRQPRYDLVEILERRVASKRARLAAIERLRRRLGTEPQNGSGATIAGDAPPILGLVNEVEGYQLGAARTAIAPIPGHAVANLISREVGERKQAKD